MWFLISLFNVLKESKKFIVARNHEYTETDSIQSVQSEDSSVQYSIQSVQYRLIRTVQYTIRTVQTHPYSTVYNPYSLKTHLSCVGNPVNDFRWFGN